MRRSYFSLFLFTIFLSCNTPQTKIISAKDFEWLKTEAKKQIQGCIIKASDGTDLYTPDGKSHYAALWTRDFAYMVENAFDLIPPEKIKKAILYLLNGQRGDGCIPDRVQADGLAVYSAGPVGHPLGDPPTDNSQFMVRLVAEYVRMTDELDFFRDAAPKLVAAMNYTPRSDDGLVYIDPQNPHSPYGFTDTIAKTGELLFSSLLYWQACRDLIDFFARIGEDDQARDFSRRAQLIEANISKLWGDERGAFYAATQDCRQLDVWGNAYAVYIDFPLAERKDRIVDFLAQNSDRYLLRGQIRHLLQPEHWGKTLIPIKPETYQNGAYWGTASGWVAAALWEKHPDLGKKIFHDLLRSYQELGIYECINRDYFKLKDYVASAVNPLGALRRIENRE